jgi:hypothetical protein
MKINLGGTVEVSLTHHGCTASACKHRSGAVSKVTEMLDRELAMHKNMNVLLARDVVLASLSRVISYQRMKMMGIDYRGCHWASTHTQEGAPQRRGGTSCRRAARTRLRCLSRLMIFRLGNVLLLPLPGSLRNSLDGDMEAQVLQEAPVHCGQWPL